MVVLEGHTSVVHRNTIYTFGGVDHSTGLLSNQTYALPLDDALGMTSRYAGTAAAASGPVGSAGAALADRQRDACVRMRLVVCRGHLPPPRCYHSATMRGPFMVVCGGETGTLEDARVRRQAQYEQWRNPQRPGGVHVPEGDLFDDDDDDVISADSGDEGPDDSRSVTSSRVGGPRGAHNVADSQRLQRARSTAVVRRVRRGLVVYALNLETLQWSRHHLKYGFENHDSWVLRNQQKLRELQAGSRAQRDAPTINGHGIENLMQHNQRLLFEGAAGIGSAADELEKQRQAVELALAAASETVMEAAGLSFTDMALAAVKRRSHASLMSCPECILMFGGYPVEHADAPGATTQPPAAPLENGRGGAAFGSGAGPLAPAHTQTVFPPSHGFRSRRLRPGAEESAAALVVDPSCFYRLFQVSGHVDVSAVASVGSVPMLWGHSAVRCHNSIVVFGGVDARGGGETAALCIYSLEDRRWRWVEQHHAATNTPDAAGAAAFAAAAGEWGPSPRALHSAVVYKASMIVHGGFNTIDPTVVGAPRALADLDCAQPLMNAQMNDTWRFCLNTGQWELWPCSGDYPVPRCGHTAMVHNDVMILLGGLETPLAERAVPGGPQQSTMSGDTSGGAMPVVSAASMGQREAGGVYAEAPAASTIAVLDLQQRHWRVLPIELDVPIAVAMQCQLPGVANDAAAAAAHRPTYSPAGLDAAFQAPQLSPPPRQGSRSSSTPASQTPLRQRPSLIPTGEDLIASFLRQEDTAATAASPNLPATASPLSDAVRRLDPHAPPSQSPPQWATDELSSAERGASSLPVRQIAAPEDPRSWARQWQAELEAAGLLGGRAPDRASSHPPTAASPAPPAPQPLATVPDSRAFPHSDVHEAAASPIPFSDRRPSSSLFVPPAVAYSPAPPPMMQPLQPAHDAPQDAPTLVRGPIFGRSPSAELDPDEHAPVTLNMTARPALVQTPPGPAPQSAALPQRYEAPPQASRAPSSAAVPASHASGAVQRAGSSPQQAVHPTHVLTAADGKVQRAASTMPNAAPPRPQDAAPTPSVVNPAPAPPTHPAVAASTVPVAEPSRPRGLSVSSALSAEDKLKRFREMKASTENASQRSRSNTGLFTRAASSTPSAHREPSSAAPRSQSVQRAAEGLARVEGKDDGGRASRQPSANGLHGNGAKVQRQGSRVMSHAEAVGRPRRGSTSGAQHDVPSSHSKEAPAKQRESGRRRGSTAQRASSARKARAPSTTESSGAESSTALSRSSSNVTVDTVTSADAVSVGEVITSGRRALGVRGTAAMLLAQELAKLQQLQTAQSQQHMRIMAEQRALQEALSPLRHRTLPQHQHQHQYHQQHHGHTSSPHRLQRPEQSPAAARSTSAVSSVVTVPNSPFGEPYATHAHSAHRFEVSSIRRSAHEHTVEKPSPPSHNHHRRDSPRTSPTRGERASHSHGQAERADFPNPHPQLYSYYDAPRAGTSSMVFDFSRPSSPVAGHSSPAPPPAADWDRLSSHSGVVVPGQGLPQTRPQSPVHLHPESLGARSPLYRGRAAPHPIQRGPPTAAASAIGPAASTAGSLRGLSNASVTFARSTSQAGLAAMGPAATHLDSTPTRRRKPTSPVDTAASASFDRLNGSHSFRPAGSTSRAPSTPSSPVASRGASTPNGPRDLPAPHTSSNALPLSLDTARSQLIHRLGL